MPIFQKNAKLIAKVREEVYPSITKLIDLMLQTEFGAAVSKENIA